jgi:MFS family permease
VLYVLAMFGCFVAFMPLAPLILPAKIATIGTIRGGAAQVVALSWLLIAGGCMAALGNIVAGHISDRLYARDGHRRWMIVAGLAAVIVALALLAAARGFAGLMIAVLAFQLALNCLLSPLVAMLVDHVDDRAKGMMAGWLGLALPAGSLAVALLARLPAIGTAAQIGVTGAITAVLVLPLLLFWPRRLPNAPPVPVRASRPAAAAPGDMLRNFGLAWTARLLIQFAAAAILPYLYHYVAQVVRPAGGVAAISTAVGTLSLGFTAASILGGLAIGAWSDRARRRQWVLAGSALAVAFGMAGLAALSLWPLVVAAYSLFAMGLAGFLAVDGAMVAQLIAASRRRATLLGIMNLTNTLPAVFAPVITLVMIGDGGREVGGRIVLLLELATAGALLAAFCAARINLPERSGRE